MPQRSTVVLSIVCLAVLIAGCAGTANSVAATPRKVQVFNIKTYGAVDDGNISSADAIKQAIADCKKAGGGVVEVPSGHYLMGPIDMVDNMTLQVDAGAVVMFDPDRAKYPDVTSRWEGLTENGPHPLIFANGLHNIAITGNGTFDGQGKTWWDNMDTAERGNARPDRPIRRRPMLLEVKDCDGVRIDGPTFTNAPFWTVHLLYSTNIDVGNCRMINPPTSPNTDALNTDSCSHVVVHDCYADVGDDAFGIKSGRDEEGRKVGRPTEYVVYQRLHVAHAHGVCVIGSEQSGGVRHVQFLDCDGDGTDNGIRIKSTRGRGGVVEDIVASNITVKNVKTAILITMHYTQTTPEPFSERTPVFRNIRIDHVTANNVTNCCTIEGLEERDIEDIHLSDLNLNGVNGVSVSYAKNVSFKNVTISAQKIPYKEDHSEDITKTNWVEIPYVAPAQ